MIIGNLNTLLMAALPAPLHDILASDICSLSALQQREDGRFQPEGAAWFCMIGPAKTQPTNQRHTEYHHQWADIQVLLEGTELIHAGPRSLAQVGDEERKPDLFIAQASALPVSIRLSVGDFVLFLPGEPHQALCVVEQPQIVRKAVFKIPRALLEV